MVAKLTSRTLALSACLFGACASSPEAPAAPEPAPEPAPVAQAEPAPAKPSVPPRGSFLALTDDRYGAFKFAPDAPHLGDEAPPIDLPDINGGRFVLADHDGPVMVMFYRGFW